MIPRSHGLATRLLDGASPHRVLVPGLDANVRDTLARLDVLGASEARLIWREGGWPVQIDRTTRAYAERNPDAIWVVELRAEAGEGLISPFRPPRVVRLDATVPVRVHESLRPRLKELQLRDDADLANAGALWVGPDNLAILGQRSLAALDDDDASRVTWWLSSGAALELKVVAEEGGGIALLLEDLVQPADAATANSGPNTILVLGPGARVPLDPDGKLPACPPDRVEALQPARSSLFDTWARYTRISREVKADRERARSAQPIEFRSATAKDGKWRAEAHLAQDAQDAWLGAGVAEGRRVQVGQPVALVTEGRDVAQFTLEEATLRGPGVVDLVLAPRRDARHLPSTGRLEAREDKGEKTRVDRERAALDALLRGVAGCERLSLLLAGPEGATPPKLSRLPTAPRDLLDEHQERAVQLIVGCQDVVAIQGPPGTGKTRVIAEALQQIAHAHRGDERRVRVLVSSVQNEAVTNVVERLAKAPGVIVRVVHREARDEDEGFDFAQRLDEQRSQVIAGLRRRLEGSDVAARLDRIRVAEDAVLEVRSLLAKGPEALEAVAARLVDVSERDSSLLPHFLREEARRIAEALVAAPPPPPPPPAEPPPTVPFPCSPEEVPAWWSAAADGWPVTERAAVGAAVQAVEEALKRDPKVRDLVLPRRWAALQAYAPTSAPPAPRTESTPEAPDPSAVAEAWLVQAREALRGLRSEVEASPEAIAHRFVLALEEDRRAWSRIVQRHGNTVAATCSMSAKAAPEPGDAYDWVIIDEAGRASPFELLVPMVQGRRIVLIGDHRQLPPMVEDALAQRAMEEGAAVTDLRTSTLFGELYKLLPAGCRARLATQYRMHEVIGDAVDTLFYRPEGEGLSSHFRGERAGARVSALGVFENRPLVWDEVASGSACGEENPKEATRVVELIRAYAAAGAGKGHVAVICPYQLQRARIEGLLALEPPEVAEVAQVKTIDAVQGREYPVVLFTLVRSDGRAGFLASPHRLNVAISRAQHQLVVLGAARRFLESPSVRKAAPHLLRLVEHVTRVGSAR